MIQSSDMQQAIKTELEKERKFSARFGSNLTPEQRAFYEDILKKESAAEAKREKYRRIEEEERKARIAHLTEEARKHIKAGVLIAKVDGRRQPIRQDLTVPCPDCEDRIDISGWIHQYMVTVEEGTTSAIRTWGGASMISPWYGTPCVFLTVPCEKCRTEHSLMVFYTGW